MKSRVRVTLPPLDVFFLPHVSDFLRIALGDSGSFPRLIKTMANAAGVEAPHLNTLKKAEQKPVTLSTAMKIKRVWHASIPDKQFLESIEAAVEPWNGLQLKNNGSSWVAALAGADRSKIGSGLKGSKVASFLEKRMAQEKSFLDWAKHETSRQPNKQHDPPRLDSTGSRLLEGAHPGGSGTHLLDRRDRPHIHKSRKRRVAQGKEHSAFG